MSEYRILRTQFTSRHLMRQALQAAGTPFEECKPGKETHLFGYHGDVRPEAATFVVRRKHIGRLSNDIGWTWNGHEFEEIVSEYDQDVTRTTEIRKAVKREYAVAATISQARAKGYRIERQDQPTGEVQLVVTGRI